MREHAVVCVIAVTLAACTSTLPREEAFSGQTGSYVLVAGDGMEVRTLHDYKFQRVDPQTSAFLPEAVFVGFPSHEFKKPETMASITRRFGGTKITPGYYALVLHYGQSDILKNLNCFSKGAPVYRFLEGSVHIVHTPRWTTSFIQWRGLLENEKPVDGEEVQAQVNDVLAGYPNMTAPRVFAEPIGYAKFETRANTCVPESGFTFSLVP